MKTIELHRATKPLAGYVTCLGSDPLVLTSNKEPVAALVPLKGIDPESLAHSFSLEFGKIIQDARAEAKRGQVSTLAQVKEEMLGRDSAPPATPSTPASKRS